MRIQNSPDFEKRMAAHEAERKKAKASAEAAIREARAAGHGVAWTPMDACPLAALELFGGVHTKFLVSDGQSVTVASVSKRFGTPIFWKKAPETVYRDGMVCLEGGEIDPREDLPKWWWEFELTDELESERQYYDSSTKPEVDFVPTHWMWLPEPPVR